MFGKKSPLFFLYNRQWPRRIVAAASKSKWEPETPTQNSLNWQGPPPFGIPRVIEDRVGGWTSATGMNTFPPTADTLVAIPFLPRPRIANGVTAMRLYSADMVIPATYIGNPIVGSQ